MQFSSSQPWHRFYGEWTPTSLDYGNATLLSQLAETIAAHPERVALRYMGEELSYAQLDAEINRAASALSARGVQRGDFVALALANRPAHVIAFYAALRLGAAVVEHNPQFTTHELTPMVAHHGARVAIAQGPAVGIFRELPQLEHVIDADADWEDFLAEGKKQTPRAEVNKDDLALILYTSGTTGTPKGATLSHGNLAANALQMAHWRLPEEHPQAMAVLPLFHSYGLTMSLTVGVVTGASISLVPAPRLELILAAIAAAPPTWLPAVPTVYQRIVDAAPELPKIAQAISGAATLPSATIGQWETQAHGFLVEGYGLTEAAPVVTCNPLNEHRRAGCIGIPMPDTQVRIDPDTGELLVRGPQVFSGYLHNPEATRTAFQDGWLRTGDLATQDADGFITLRARLKETIITGGFNIYPGEVEEVLLSHPVLADAAVIGRPRPDGSEDVVACIVLASAQPGAPADAAQPTQEELREWCRGQLARYKVPREFIIVPDLGRDGLGKLRRRAVAERFL
ncbi:AMP-binding protein [uncultured Corynebacterium sp.]|uniref:AMP-binding protein n=1 Tax=uncultured Corynebacterium sp. TaxID=159447 RepID=UPI00288B5674|nr:AMP-binding protein [uncultured Corynebacterium sp.]